MRTSLAVFAVVAVACAPQRVELAERCYELFVVDSDGGLSGWPDSSPYWHAPALVRFTADAGGRIQVHAAPDSPDGRGPFGGYVWPEGALKAGDSVVFSRDNGFHGVRFHLAVSRDVLAGRIIEIGDVGYGRGVLDSVILVPYACTAST